MNLKGKYENETDCFGDKFSGNSASCTGKKTTPNAADNDSANVSL
nr:hypothetical protein [uncultured Prevotella sp.]